MIAKAKATSNMRLFHYLMGSDKDFELLLSYFVLGDTPDEIVQETIEIGRLRPLKNPFLHIILSLDKTDSDRDFVPLVDQFVERLGVQDCQCVAVVHWDRTSETRGVHCHLVVNRVSLSGRVVSDKMIGIRVRDIAQKMNVELGLHNEYDRSNRRGHSYAKNRYVSQRKAEALERLRAVCASALQASGSKRDFYSRLSRASVRVEQVRSQKGSGVGRVVGQRFWFEGYSYKASEVGRGYSLRSLNAQIPYGFGLSSAVARAVASVRSPKATHSRSVLQHLGQLCSAATTPEPLRRGFDEEDNEEQKYQQLL